MSIDDVKVTGVPEGYETHVVDGSTNALILSIDKDGDVTFFTQLDSAQAVVDVLLDVVKAVNAGELMPQNLNSRPTPQDESDETEAPA